MQRNLHPRVLTSINRIDLRHFGQVGGGIFLGMAAHLGSGGSVTELAVTGGCLILDLAVIGNLIPVCAGVD